MRISTRIISDHGSAFISEEFEQYVPDHSIEHLITATEHPRGNGQMESIIRIILSLFRKLSFEKPNQYYRNMGNVQLAINIL